MIIILAFLSVILFFHFIEHSVLLHEVNCRLAVFRHKTASLPRADFFLDHLDLTRLFDLLDYKDRDTC